MKREVRMLAERRIYWFVMIFAPLFCFLFFMDLLKEGLPKKLPVAVVDEDNTTTSRSLVRSLNTFAQTDVVMRTANFSEAREALQRGDVYGIFYIPADFRRDASTGGEPVLSFYTNDTYFLAGSLLYKDMRMQSNLANGAVQQTLLLAKGEGVNLLPPAVYGYILREGLYGTRADLKRLPLRELRPIALSYLKNKRIPHVLGTEQEAIRLAERYGADVEKARVAALLHDCTKKLNMEEQLELCGRYGIQLDELEQKALKLLHAKTGAAIARDVFGVDDEIYNAIWWHTTGHAHMTLLEKVIYLADYIEPSRNFPGVDKLRAVCYKDLDEGLLMGLEMTIEEMTEMGNPVHHATIEARDALKG